MDNPIYRELPDEDEYFGLKSDERVYLDLRASSGYVREAEKLERNDSKINLMITLKEAAKYNLRVRIWAYSLSEYLYVKKRTYSKTQNLRYKSEWRWFFRIILKLKDKRMTIILKCEENNQ